MSYSKYTNAMHKVFFFMEVAILPPGGKISLPFMPYGCACPIISLSAMVGHDSVEAIA